MVWHCLDPSCRPLLWYLKEICEVLKGAYCSKQDLNCIGPAPCCHNISGQGTQIAKIFQFSIWFSPQSHFSIHKKWQKMYSQGGTRFENPPLFFQHFWHFKKKNCQAFSGTLLRGFTKAIITAAVLHCPLQPTLQASTCGHVKAPGPTPSAPKQCNLYVYVNS